MDVPPAAPQPAEPAKKLRVDRALSVRGLCNRCGGSFTFLKGGELRKHNCVQ